MSSDIRVHDAYPRETEAEQSRGMLVVVSSPSGGGKGTLIQRALKLVPNLSYSVSFTTRAPREGETNGREYFFVSIAEFMEMVEAGEFLEWAVVHGNYYGTARNQVKTELAAGHDIILEIDVQGATTVRALSQDAVEIFILPPSFEILRERLIGRGSELPVDLDLRLRNARGEVECYRDFDYVIINDDAESAASQLASIVAAERARCERQEGAARRVIATFPTERAQAEEASGT
jgi:guanylate kinase